MQASIEMTEQLATEIHEEVQGFRKELRQLATGLEEILKTLLDREANSRD